MKILVTGAAGFISGYLIPELLNAGHEVIGIDNFSKYGKIQRSFEQAANYEFVEGDAKNTGLMKELMSDCDQIVAAAAMVGGISYFHKYRYDLLAENERITAATLDAAIWAFQKRKLKKINVISSSMVYESVETFPLVEGSEQYAPPPRSSYGFQKLSCEVFARSAQVQYDLPFTIIRPFNCVGVGEYETAHTPIVTSNNIKLGLSHVVPDFINKALLGLQPFPIFGDGHQIRHFTYGGDLAKGIRLCMELPQALNETFNLSTGQSTTILELAKIILSRIHPGQGFDFSFEPFLEHDVRRRVPSIKKAEEILGFRAETKLEIVIDEVIGWMKQIKLEEARGHG